MLLTNEVCSLSSYMRIHICANISIYVYIYMHVIYIHISIWYVCVRDTIIGMLVSSLHNLMQSFLRIKKTG